MTEPTTLTVVARLDLEHRALLEEIRDLLRDRRTKAPGYLAAELTAQNDRLRAQNEALNKAIRESGEKARERIERALAGSAAKGKRPSVGGLQSGDASAEVGDQVDQVRGGHEERCDDSLQHLDPATRVVRTRVEINETLADLVQTTAERVGSRLLDDDVESVHPASRYRDGVSQGADRGVHLGASGSSSSESPDPATTGPFRVESPLDQSAIDDRLAEIDTRLTHLGDVVRGLAEAIQDHP